MAPLMAGVRVWPCGMVRTAVPVQPPALVAVTVYVPAAVAVICAVVAPVLHE